MAKSNDSHLLSQLYIVLLAVAASALVIAIYHCISVLRWNRYQHQRSRLSDESQRRNHEDMASSIENSFIGLIPVHKHRKSTGLDGQEDGMCSICLCEFEEGEELRTLPECQHSYHAPCIDMWLYSHPNCPMCRTDATPTRSPHIQIIHIPDSGGSLPMNHPLSHHPLSNHPSSSEQQDIDVLSMSV